MKDFSVLQVRLTSDIKLAAEEVLNQLGMSHTEAIRLLYAQIAIRREFPLELKTKRSPEDAVSSRKKRSTTKQVHTFDSVDELLSQFSEQHTQNSTESEQE